MSKQPPVSIHYHSKPKLSLKLSKISPTGPLLIGSPLRLSSTSSRPSSRASSISIDSNLSTRYKPESHTDVEWPLLPRPDSRTSSEPQSQFSPCNNNVNVKCSDKLSCESNQATKQTNESEETHSSSGETRSSAAVTCSRTRSGSSETPSNSAVTHSSSAADTHSNSGETRSSSVVTRSRTRSGSSETPSNSAVSRSSSAETPSKSVETRSSSVVTCSRTRSGSAENSAVTHSSSVVTRSSSAEIPKSAETRSGSAKTPSKSVVTHSSSAETRFNSAETPSKSTVTRSSSAETCSGSAKTPSKSKVTHSSSAGTRSNSAKSISAKNSSISVKAHSSTNQPGSNASTSENKGAASNTVTTVNKDKVHTSKDDSSKKRKCLKLKTSNKKKNALKRDEKVAGSSSSISDHQGDNKDQETPSSNAESQESTINGNNEPTVSDHERMDEGLNSRENHSNHDDDDGDTTGTPTKSKGKRGRPPKKKSMLKKDSDKGSSSSNLPAEGKRKTPKSSPKKESSEQVRAQRKRKYNEGPSIADSDFKILCAGDKENTRNTRANAKVDELHLALAISASLYHQQQQEEKRNNATGNNHKKKGTKRTRLLRRNYTPPPLLMTSSPEAKRRLMERVHEMLDKDGTESSEEDGGIPCTPAMAPSCIGRQPPLGLGGDQGNGDEVMVLGEGVEEGNDPIEEGTVSMEEGNELNEGGNNGENEEGIGEGDNDDERANDTIDEECGGNEDRISINKEGTTIIEEGPGIIEEGPGNDIEGPGIIEEGPGINEEGPGINEEGPGINEEGPGINEEGPGINEEGPGINEEGPGIIDKESTSSDDDMDTCSLIEDTICPPEGAELSTTLLPSTPTCTSPHVVPKGHTPSTIGHPASTRTSSISNNGFKTLWRLSAYSENEPVEEFIAEILKDKLKPHPPSTPGSCVKCMKCTENTTTDIIQTIEQQPPEQPNMADTGPAGSPLVESTVSGHDNEDSIVTTSPNRSGRKRNIESKKDQNSNKQKKRHSDSPAHHQDSHTHRQTTPISSDALIDQAQLLLNHAHQSISHTHQSNDHAHQTNDHAHRPNEHTRQSIKQVNSHDQLTTDFYLLFRGGLFSDLNVLTSDPDKGPISAHRGVLCSRCPSLIPVLTASNETVNVLDLSAFSYQSVSIFLEFLYTAQIRDQPKDERIVDEVTMIAGLWDVKELVDLVTNEPTEDNTGSHDIPRTCSTTQTSPFKFPKESQLTDTCVQTIDPIITSLGIQTDVPCNVTTSTQTISDVNSVGTQATPPLVESCDGSVQTTTVPVSSIEVQTLPCKCAIQVETCDESTQTLPTVSEDTEMSSLNSYNSSQPHEHKNKKKLLKRPSKKIPTTSDSTSDKSDTSLTPPPPVISPMIIEYGSLSSDGHQRIMCTDNSQTTCTSVADVSTQVIPSVRDQHIQTNLPPRSTCDQLTQTPSTVTTQDTHTQTERRYMTSICTQVEPVSTQDQLIEANISLSTCNQETQTVHTAPVKTNDVPLHTLPIDNVSCDTPTQSCSTVNSPASRGRISTSSQVFPFSYLLCGPPSVTRPGVPSRGRQRGATPTGPSVVYSSTPCSSGVRLTTPTRGSLQSDINELSPVKLGTVSQAAGTIPTTDQPPLLSSTSSIDWNKQLPPTVTATTTCTEGTGVTTEGKKVTTEGTKVTTEGTGVTTEGTKVTTEGTGVTTKGTEVITFTTEGTGVTQTQVCDTGGLVPTTSVAFMGSFQEPSSSLFDLPSISHHLSPVEEDQVNMEDDPIATLPLPLLSPPSHDDHDLFDDHSDIIILDSISRQPTPSLDLSSPLNLSSPPLDGIVFDQAAMSPCNTPPHNHAAISPPGQATPPVPTTCPDRTTPPSDQAMSPLNRNTLPPQLTTSPSLSPSLHPSVRSVSFADWITTNQTTDSPKQTTPPPSDLTTPRIDQTIPSPIPSPLPVSLQPHVGINDKLLDLKNDPPLPPPISDDDTEIIYLKEGSYSPYPPDTAQEIEFPNNSSSYSEYKTSNFFQNIRVVQTTPTVTINSNSTPNISPVTAPVCEKHLVTPVLNQAEDEENDEEIVNADVSVAMEVSIFSDDLDPYQLSDRSDEKFLVYTPLNGKNDSSVLMSGDNITPLPSYRTMATPSLKEACSSYGIRPLPKGKMIAKLEEIYEYTHPLVDKNNKVVMAKKSPPKRQYKKKNLSKKKQKNPSSTVTTTGTGTTTNSTTHITATSTDTTTGTITTADRTTDTTTVTITATSTVTTATDVTNATTTATGTATGTITGTDTVTNTNSTFEAVTGEPTTDTTTDTTTSTNKTTNSIPTADPNPPQDAKPVLGSAGPENELKLIDCVIDIIKRDCLLHQQILMYQPCDLLTIQSKLKDKGLKLSREKLSEVLDKLSVTFICRPLPRVEAID